MTIAPAILEHYPDPSEAQREVVARTEDPWDLDRGRTRLLRQDHGRSAALGIFLAALDCHFECLSDLLHAFRSQCLDHGVEVGILVRVIERCQATPA